MIDYALYGICRQVHFQLTDFIVTLMGVTVLWWAYTALIFESDAIFLECLTDGGDILRLYIFEAVQFRKGYSD